MPIFEFQCKKCQAVTEVFCRDSTPTKHAVTCRQCGSRALSKVISRVGFKIAQRAKYGEDFLHKARPFLRAQKETAQYFAEGKGSEDARTFALAEKIGEHVDQTLASQLPSRKR